MDILLADDRVRVRNALRVLLEQQPDWKIVAEARDACELVDQSRFSQPDLVLLDGELPGIHVQETLHSIRAACPHVTIIALLNPQSLHLSQEVINADGYATKVNSPDYLLSVIRSCLTRRACK